MAMVDRLVRLRQDRIKKSVPDALDLLVVCVEAGTSLDAAILRVAKELRLAHPDLSHELAVVNRLTNAGMPREEALRRIPEILSQMQADLLARARALRTARTRTIDDGAAFERFFAGEGGGFALCHWCGDGACEKAIAEKHRTSIRNQPLDAREEKGACIRCGNPSSRRVVMAQAY